MNNLAQLILDRGDRYPDARFGTVENPLRLSVAVGIARQAAQHFSHAGLHSGACVALIGGTSTSYLLAWMALQLAGIETALINPSFPDDLIALMLGDLQAQGVAWFRRPPSPQVAPDACHLDASDLAQGRLLREGRCLLDGSPATAPPPGLRRKPGDVAGYMHTSGTTGRPKCCIQTHHYFLSLGRFVAESMSVTPADTVFAPLPMFHINPLGYGVVGGLTGGASVLGTEAFSARRFWPAVKEIGATTVFLHGPPVAILNKATAPVDADGHRLRAAFLADAAFLERFRVPYAFSAYGSTEAGGMCHIRKWRRGEPCPHPEGISRCAGAARPDVDWDLTPEGEILVAERKSHVLSSGYQTAGGRIVLTDAEGWFHSGDLGRRDEQGNLVFSERLAESIRVKGEYVPISYVEQVFAEIEELADVALWRTRGDLGDHKIELYVVCEEPIPMEKIRDRAATLPAFMRPATVKRVESLPREKSVGKVSRRKLEDVAVNRVAEL